MSKPAWYQKVNHLSGRLHLLPNDPSPPPVLELRPAVPQAPPKADPPPRFGVTRTRLVLCVLVGFLAYAAGRALWLGLAASGAEVSAQPVVRGEISERVPTVALGRVSAERELSLRSEFAARVKKLNFRVGDRVRSGDPLISLEALSDLRNAVAGAERALTTARSQAGEAALRAELAQRKEARSLPLAISGALSPADAEALTLERKIANRATDSLRARAKELEVSLITARRNLSRSQIRAPYDAIVLEVPVEEGQAVLPGATLMRLADDSALHVSAAVDEADLRGLSVGMPVELGFEAFDEPPLRRVLSRIEPSVIDGERGGRVVGIRVDLADTSRLRVGMGVHVDLVRAERKSAVIAPLNALIGTGPRRSAFVVVDGEAHLRQLNVGISNWESTEVTVGLAPGETLLLNPGATRVEDGQRVRVSSLSVGNGVRESAK
jgi:RND family efflux transporter MFP subunit